jgi:HD-GYP domain-containing protein (c-di-GMP phosphodiesterase class II)
MTNISLSEPTEELDFTSSILLEVYDATLEVLSSALDLRDKQARGHTQRVTEMTVELAKLMGLSNQELENIRRGAILHDFGNITIPESILYKKDELTVEEWVTIHLHPYTAYEMLEHIVYLRPALEIPYRHHERWDGSGYPRGLKGEEIPLAARIFSVVDVYDSLTSDRPYRSAWSNDSAKEYIQEMSGKQFDPIAVELFLDMISHNT